MKLLMLALCNGRYRQILRKIDEQFQAMSRLNSETFCTVIGRGLSKEDKSNVQFDLVDMDALGEPQNRAADFEQCARVIRRTKPDIVYFRYPIFDAISYQFVCEFDRIVFEHQSIATNEVSPKRAHEERRFGSRILARALGIVAVTPEFSVTNRLVVRRNSKGTS